MVRFSQRRIVVVAVVGLVLLSGCSAPLGGSGGAGDAAPGPDGDRNLAGGDGGDGAAAPENEDGAAFAAATGVDATSVQRQRDVIRTGQVDIEVESFGTARESVVSATRDHGGFVSGSDRNVHTRGDENWTTGRLVLRVPSENFSDLKTDVEAVGTVRNSETEREDITEQLADLEARLANLRAERDRLRTLYEEANETEDVLAVGERLSDVQGEIERLEAKQRSLEGKVAYSTLTVELSEPRPGPAAVDTEQWYDTGVVSAFLSSIDGVLVTLRALSVGIAYALPYVLVFGIPLAGIGYLVRRRPWRTWELFERS